MFLGCFTHQSGRIRNSPLVRRTTLLGFVARQSSGTLYSPRVSRRPRTILHGSVARISLLFASKQKAKANNSREGGLLGYFLVSLLVKVAGLGVKMTNVDASRLFCSSEWSESEFSSSLKPIKDDSSRLCCSPRPLVARQSRKPLQISHTKVAWRAASWTRCSSKWLDSESRRRFCSSEWSDSEFSSSLKTIS
jgi:hypothetical protein